MGTVPVFTRVKILILFRPDEYTTNAKNNLVTYNLVTKQWKGYSFQKEENDYFSFTMCQPSLFYSKDKHAFLNYSSLCNRNFYWGDRYYAYTSVLTQYSNDQFKREEDEILNLAKDPSLKIFANISIVTSE